MEEEKCPCCERKFSGIQDFPLIYISGFKRLEIPEVIKARPEIYFENKSKELTAKNLPKDVARLFKESGEKVISHQGIIYEREGETEFGILYRASKNIADIVRPLILIPEFQQTLSFFENSVGKEYRYEELSSLPGFRNFEAQGFNDISLQFSNLKLGLCLIDLTAGWSGGSLSEASIYQHLGELNYEGRINKK